ncbi:MAG: hypothetical protein KKF58_01780 [Gammaproteobacteria bacterium]|nr:hypothetical protein [Gammaproteobacteria bacterium]
MKIKFLKLTSSSLAHLAMHGYLDNVETCFEFASGQGDNLFIEVSTCPLLTENDKSFILCAASALLTGGAFAKNELENLVYDVNHHLIMFDQFQYGRTERFFEVDWDMLQPLSYGWLITCAPPSGIEGALFCEVQGNQASMHESCFSTVKSVH